MRYITTVFLLLCSISALSQQHAVFSDLRSLQWNKRIILVNQLPQHQSVVALFDENKNEINERDIIWFVFTGHKVDTNYQGILSGDFMATTTARYQLKPGKIMLIGKDGGVKFLLDQLDLAALFSEIDAMPMRQYEMEH